MSTARRTNKIIIERKLNIHHILIIRSNITQTKWNCIHVHATRRIHTCPTAHTLTDTLTSCVYMVRSHYSIVFHSVTQRLRTIRVENVDPCLFHFFFFLSLGTTELSDWTNTLSMYLCIRTVFDRCCVCFLFDFSFVPCLLEARARVCMNTVCKRIRFFVYIELDAACRFKIVHLVLRFRTKIQCNTPHNVWWISNELFYIRLFCSCFCYAFSYHRINVLLANKVCVCCCYIAKSVI